MHIEHPHSKSSRRLAGLRDRVRNIVELEIEEYGEFQSVELFNQRWTSSGKQLFADLQSAELRTEPPCERQRIGRVCEIQSNDNFRVASNCAHRNLLILRTHSHAASSRSSLRRGGYVSQP